MKDIEMKVRQILGNVKDKDKVRKIMNLIKKVKEDTTREIFDSSRQHRFLLSGQGAKRKKFQYPYHGYHGEPLTVGL